MQRASRDSSTFSTATPQGEQYLLVIGINNYPTYPPHLSEAAGDARAVVELLTKKYGFEQKNIFELYNNDATQDAIISTLNKVQQTVGAQDNLLIYFAAG